MSVHVVIARAHEMLGGRVLVLLGDITQQKVDVIVNAANRTLLGGGGVDGAIHEAGGPEILAACEELRRTDYGQGLETGQVVLTTAGRLPARGVIHTVGPIKGVNREQESHLLTSCYLNALMLAAQHGFSSIAFPAISTGIYGYPREEAAVISSLAISRFLETNRTIQHVRLVFFTEHEVTIFMKHHKFPSCAHGLVES